MGEFIDNYGVSWDGSKVFYMALGHLQIRYIEAIVSDNVIEAIELLKQEYLHIVGYIPENEEERKAKGLNISNKIIDSIIDTTNEIDQVFNVEIDNCMKSNDLNSVKDWLFVIKKQLSKLQKELNMKVRVFDNPDIERGLY